MMLSVSQYCRLTLWIPLLPGLWLSSASDAPMQETAKEKEAAEEKEAAKEKEAAEEKKTAPGACNSFVLGCVQ